jgi:hypothetical protein
MTKQDLALTALAKFVEDNLKASGITCTVRQFNQDYFAHCPDDGDVLSFKGKCPYCGGEVIPKRITNTHKRAKLLIEDEKCPTG